MLQLPWLQLRRIWHTFSFHIFPIHTHAWRQYKLDNSPVCNMTRWCTMQEHRCLLCNTISCNGSMIYCIWPNCRQFFDKIGSDWECICCDKTFALHCYILCKLWYPMMMMIRMQNIQNPNKSSNKSLVYCKACCRGRHYKRVFNTLCWVVI